MNKYLKDNRIWVWLGFLLLWPMAVSAQGTTSRVTGNVFDANKAAVAGATVKLTNDGTGVTFETQTGEDGGYVFESVQVGSYTITVEKGGFKKFVSQKNGLTIGQPLRVDATLETGAIEDVVTVQASGELVQTSSSGNVGNLVDQRTVVALPIVGSRGRNPLQFINFQPGVAVGSNTGGGVHVHGARDRAFNFTIDGIDSNETSAGGSNFSPIRFNPDAIAEFRAITSNPTAENGRSSGANVSLVTRSGTNEFHGTAFYFYQTPRFQANQYQNNLNRVAKPQFVQHIPGGSIGGPIFKNKTFFFFNMQALRATETRPRTRTVYTQQARQGIFRYVRGGINRPAGVAGAAVDANGNVLPGVNIGTYDIGANDPQRLGYDQTVRRLLAATPLPNNFTVGDGLNTAGFSFNSPGREVQEDYTVKIDHIISDRQTIYGRYSFGRQNSNGDFANAGEPAFPSTPRLVDTRRTPKNLAINHRWSPTASITNEAVVGLNRFTFSFDNGAPDQATIFSLNDVTDPLPIGDVPTFNRRALTTIQVVDNLSYIRGAHTIRGGINFRFGRHIDRRTTIGGQQSYPLANFSIVQNPVVPATFNLPGDIDRTNDLPRLQRTVNNLLGRVGRITQAFVAVSDTQFGRPGTIFNVDARYPEYDFYIQDTWRVTPRLIVDAGLRLEGRPAPSARGGKFLVPNRRVAAFDTPSNTLAWGQGKPFDDDWNNFAPSIGVAWDPFGDGKTSIRANYRLAYDRLNTFVTSSFILPNIPGTTVAVVNDAFGASGGRISGLPTLAPPTGATPASFRQPAAFGNGNVTVFDPEYRTPKTNMWSLSIQRDLGKGMVLEVNYIGRRGVGLFGAYNANQVEIRNNGFLDAFNTVKAGGDSPLMNALLANHSGRPTAQTGSQFARTLFVNELALNNVAGAANTIATRVQGASSLLALGGFSPFFFYSFPQFNGGITVLDSNDISTYHGLEVQIQRRSRNGLSYQLAYTFAKSLDTRSFDPTFTTAAAGSAQSASSSPFDLQNRYLNYARSDFDRTHSFQGNFVWDLPFGRGQKYAANLNPVVDRIIGGWNMAGIITWTSGRPFTVFSGSNTLSNAVQSFANCNGCSRDMGRTFQEQGTTFYFDAAERARFSVPDPGRLGNTGRNFFTGPGFFQLDLMIGKRFRITERQALEYRLEMQNATNTVSFGFPTAVVNSPTFGRIRDSVASSARGIQMALKYSF